MSLANKMLFTLQTLFQSWHQVLQGQTEIMDLDAFEEMMNYDKEQNFKQIVDSRSNIKINLKTIDDTLEMFDGKQEELEEVMLACMLRRAMSPENEEVNTEFEEAKKHQKAFEEAKLSLKEKKAGVVQEEKDLQQVEKYIQAQYDLLQQQVSVVRKMLHRGLTDERIQRFRKLEADKSMAGEQCAVCMDEFEVGRKLMQLDCKHEFCQECVEGWLADHNTCPVCRKVFENE